MNDAVMTDAVMSDVEAPLQVRARIDPTIADVSATVDRTYAGLPLSTLVLGGLMLLMLLWAAWATRELVALRSHRTVSVSLASLVRDFVAAEARNGGTPEVTAARTRIYIGTIGGAVKAMADDGSTVLVSEAVLGNSVPDVTPQLKAAVDARLRTMVPPTGGSNGR